MRIERHNVACERMDRLKADVAEAVCPLRPNGRICGETCTAVCPQCGSTTCQCSCSPDCTDAPQTLSSDPENHPIEPEIVPLVFEMKRHGLFVPCWSCGGHLHSDGSLWKPPRVWFYCHSTAHLRFLSNGLKQLELAEKLSNRWHVTATFSDSDNPEATFSLEPDLSSLDETDLASMQKDVLEIAAAFDDMMTLEAKKLQVAMEDPIVAGS